MEEYKNRLKELISNFSYEEFIGLVNEIDQLVITGKLKHFDSEFIYYFDQITSFTNESYLIDNNQPGTLGHMLLETTLLEKRKISPTTAICFFLEQKKNIGLDNLCNDVSFYDMENSAMYIDDRINNGLLNININYFETLESSIDSNNFRMMWMLLHELTHVYQYTRAEQTENVFDKLAYYDYQQLKNLQQFGNGYNTVLRIHQSFLSEFMADEQAHVFMLNLGNKHPEYFNTELLKNHQEYYQNRKQGFRNIDDYDPREVEAAYISEIKGYLTEAIEDFDEQVKGYSNNPEFLRQLISQWSEIVVRADQISEKRQPLIEKLRMQGISEKSSDKNYSIYLNSLYSFDGDNITLDSSFEKNEQEVNFYK